MKIELLISKILGKNQIFWLIRFGPKRFWVQARLYVHQGWNLAGGADSQVSLMCTVCPRSQEPYHTVP